MATASSPIPSNQGLLEMLQQAVPTQGRAMEIYRRLLEIHALATMMNVANDLAQLRSCLSAAFMEWMPQECVRLCLIEGSNYRRLHLSGPDGSGEEGPLSLAEGVAGRVLRTGTPFQVTDLRPPRGNGRSAKLELGLPPRSMMVLPFSASDKIIGCLELISAVPRRFDELDYHLTSLVAAHLSSCLESIRTREELAQANASLRDRDRRLTQLNQRLAELAQTDEATGLFNKRRLFEQLEAEIARAKRYGEILSCLMLDIDHFKRINDSFGHEAGDRFLREVGSLLRRSVRVTDFVARYGGEEFTLILPRTDSKGAHSVAEHLRLDIKNHLFEFSGTQIPLTVSIGIASCTKFDNLDAHQIILSADTALYQAKHAGRDRVCSWAELNPD
jgi:diguanylate cyclase (GGDEF)-like protein